MSRSAFADRFATLVGEPPLQYLARWRMARAGELLRGSTTRVNEIAMEVGYTSVTSFNKAFRKWQGVTPSVFRAAVGRPDAGHWKDRTFCERRTRPRWTDPPTQRTLGG